MEVKSSKPKSVEIKKNETEFKSKQDLRNKPLSLKLSTNELKELGKMSKQYKMTRTSLIIEALKYYEQHKSKKD